ncbi:MULTISPECIES: HEAT repeat domain-containing protein [Prochlorococcus]|uniref:HEAT repeat domain-containing protein n=1 Tax=Prochlorococcus TaxID=1218 RepID=UPI0005337222|nr:MULTISPECIES: HEAT repeat domain-containing protein [Prochlorococcus]KGG13551.1 hypothetical protein EV05_0206 [Prochlorococcus sp. MIT 0601]
MNQFFAVTAALIVGLTLWGLGKKPKILFRSVFDEVLPLETNERVIVKEKFKTEELSSTDCFLEDWTAPRTAKERLLLKKNLFRLISLGPSERLYAVQIAKQWGHASVLPILRRGLKDSDSLVVISAAEGMTKFRNASKTLKAHKVSRLPLNVSLMR